MLGFLQAELGWAGLSCPPRVPRGITQLLTFPYPFAGLRRHRLTTQLPTGLSAVACVHHTAAPAGPINRWLTSDCFIRAPGGRGTWLQEHLLGSGRMEGNVLPSGGGV